MMLFPRTVITQPYCFLLDIDGTILGYQKDNKRSDPRLSALFSKFISAGAIIGLVTGRPYGFAKDLYKQLGLNGPIIAEMGGIFDIKGDGKFQVVGGFDEEQRKRIEEFVLEHEISKRFGMQLEEGDTSMVTLLHTSFPESIPEHIAAYAQGITPEIKERFPEVVVDYDHFSFDIYNRKVSKGKTLSGFHNLISGERLLFVGAGDSTGDFPLFRFVQENNGINVYVGNVRTPKRLSELRDIDPKIVFSPKLNSSGLADFLESLKRD